MNLIKTVESFDTYLDEILILTDYLIICSACDTIVTSPTKSYIHPADYSKFEDIGLKMFRQNNIAQQFWSGYAAIISHGKVVYEKLAGRNENVIYDYSADNLKIHILSSLYKNMNKASIVINGQDYSVNCRGLNIVVVDTEKMTVVDSVNFDTWADSIPYSRKFTQNEQIIHGISRDANQQIKDTENKHSETSISENISAEILDRLEIMENKLEILLSRITDQDALQTKQNQIIQQKIQKATLQIVRESQKRNPLERRPNTDIRKQLFELAGYETAQYVKKYMMKCHVFSTPEKLRENAIGQVVLDGLHLEFGVFSGKSINQVAALKEDQIFYGFDSFEGLPETWRTGFYTHAFSRESLPQVRENVKLIKGWFDEILPGFCEEHKDNCAYLHIDCDLYSSTKTVFKELKDRIVPGTIIVFDEYFNYPSWQEHEFKAFHEFVEENNIRYEYLGYVPTFEQVSVRII